MHLFVDISSHGFGHLAQTAPVLNALRQRLPELELTLRCGLPRERIARRIHGEFTHLAEASDFGLVMKSALEVDVPASLAAYREFHADWDARVAREAELLAKLAPDLVLSNVSYLALAGAKRAGIPSLALCSLNWAGIAAPYFRDAPDFAAIHAQMLAAYRGADAFLRLTPGMDMPELDNVVTIGPVAQPGENKRHLLPQDTRIVLVAMGGVGVKLPANWPVLPGVTWIVPRNSGLERADVRIYNRDATHTVQPDETITSIAWDYGVPYLYIQGANSSLEDGLSVGETITIPSGDNFLEFPVIPNKRIVVSIGEQRVRVYEDGALKWDWIASTGIASSPTWTGIYQVISHEPNAYAGNWDLWMPNFMGVYRPIPGADFTNGFHGFPTRGGSQLLWTNSLGTRVTYGCILLSNDNIQQLYDWAEEGVVVEIQA